MTEIVAWYALMIRIAARMVWDSIPGPWYIKVVLLAVTQVIPGQFDDILIFGAIALYRTWRRRALAEVTS